MESNEILRYCQLLHNKGYREADFYKNSLLPQFLYKYISLTSDKEENLKRFKTIKSNKIWCSHCSAYNDPFELFALYNDESKMLNEGYKEEQIKIVKNFYEKQRDILRICSFSESNNNMPMWEHYANNHQGFCIKYKIINQNDKIQGDKIFPVLYAEARIEAHDFINEFLVDSYNAYKYNLQPSEKSMAYISYMYLASAAKHISWAYEKEYRVLYSKESPEITIGENIPCNVCGIKIDCIYLGYSCSIENREILSNISKELNIEPIKQMKLLSNDKFELVPEEI